MKITDVHDMYFKIGRESIFNHSAVNSKLKYTLYVSTYTFVHMYALYAHTHTMNKAELSCVLTLFRMKSCLPL